MTAVALVISYLVVVFIIVVIVVLICLGCSCHIPLGRFVRCFCDSTTRCCNKKKKKKKTNADMEERGTKEEMEGTIESTAEGAKKSTREAKPLACMESIPWILTCGFCFGALADDNSNGAKWQGGSSSAVVAQPVFDKAPPDYNEVTGTEAVVAIFMPLLRIG